MSEFAGKAVLVTGAAAASGARSRWPSPPKALG